MIEVANNTVHYFQYYPNYFWHWAEDGNVIEWKDGSTICYTEDVVMLMKAVTNSGVPSFGSLLLILAACNEKWFSSPGLINILNDLKNSIEKSEFDSDDSVLEYYINQAIKCMNMIAALPREMRTGMRRAHLLHELGKEIEPVLEEAEIRIATDELLSGRLEEYMLTDPVLITREQYKQDLECLVKIFHTYSVPKKLEQKLRTGIFEMPAPSPVEFPESLDGDVLEDLLNEPKTAGMANLAKRLVAALNIPLHSQGSSDQLFGGISDISNRGNFDRLLLSELAYDDTILMARLANNESLYLRREELPAQPKNKRIILIDTTIKMWGTPRIFAMSAAIACTVNVKHGEDVEAFMLGFDNFSQANTKTAKGVMQALEGLDPHMNCFESLEKFCKSKIANKETDTFFIGRKETLHDVQFQRLLAAYPEVFNFIIAIDRSGEMQFHEAQKGRTKQLLSAKFDLEDILNPKKSGKKISADRNGRPAFLVKEVAPLLYPYTSIRDYESNTIYHPKLGVAGITEKGRLLYWPTVTHGAIELLADLVPGSYSLGFNGDCMVYLLASNKVALTLYSIHVKEGGQTKTEIAFKNTDVKIVFHESAFYLQTGQREDSQVAIINCKTSEMEGTKSFALCHHIFKNPDLFKIQSETSIAKGYVNNGYNVLHRVKELGINSDNNISFDKKVITAASQANNHISLKTRGYQFKIQAEKIEEQFDPIENINLTTFTWPDGSKAIIDSKGFMHLVSSDPSLPEISLVMIQGKATTCWSSDGKVTGNEYFIPTNKTDYLISPANFHQNYIEPFISRILQS